MTIVGIIGISSLLVSFVATSSVNGEDEKLLTMRVLEASAGLASQIVIVDENGKMENISLEKTITKDPFLNTVKINKTLNRITEDGYKLATTAMCGDQNFIITTYTFVKK